MEVTPQHTQKSNFALLDLDPAGRERARRNARTAPWARGTRLSGVTTNRKTKNRPPQAGKERKPGRKGSQRKEAQSKKQKLGVRRPPLQPRSHEPKSGSTQAGPTTQGGRNNTTGQQEQGTRVPRSHEPERGSTQGGPATTTQGRKQATSQQEQTLRPPAPMP